MRRWSARPPPLGGLRFASWANGTLTPGEATTSGNRNPANVRGPQSGR